MQRRFHDTLTEQIIEGIIAVHAELGPGFLESIYRNALQIELRSQGLKIEHEKEVRVFYRHTEVGIHRLDLLVEGKVIVELKTVEGLSRAHYAQLRSYLKAVGCSTGLLVNFAGDKADYRRVEREV